MRRLIATLVLVLTWSAASASPSFSVKVGTTDILLPQADGYVRVSETSPALFTTSSAALPPTLRLVEMLMAESDLKGKLMGRNAALPFLQMQVMRDSEAFAFSAEEWTQLRPQLVKQLGLLDLDGVAHGVQGGASDRMSEASGSTTEMKFGKVGKPQIYSEDAESVRFASRLPLSFTVNGASVDVVLQGASAVLLVRGKLVFLSAYLTDDPAARSDTQVRAYLDEAIAAIRALNADVGAEVETKDAKPARSARDN